MWGVSWGRVALPQSELDIGKSNSGLHPCSPSYSYRSGDGPRCGAEVEVHEPWKALSERIPASIATTF